jgi:hypothetical protein
MGMQVSYCMDTEMSKETTIRKNSHVLGEIFHELARQRDVRNDKPHLMNIQIRYENEFFEDIRSGIRFGQWLVKTVSY